MALSETMHKLETLLTSLTRDLTKTGRGNKTAAQRVRVGTVKLEKVARIFRKESVQAEKGKKGKKLSLKKTRKKS